MTLIYFFTEKSESNWLINDYIRLSFKNCLVFYYSENLTHVTKFISELKNKIKPQNPKIIDIDKLVEKDKKVNAKEIVLTNFQEFLKKSDETLFTIYLKQVELPTKHKTIGSSLLNFIKIILESFVLLYEPKIKEKRKIIVDLTNCSLLNSNLIYFLLLKYISEYNIKTIDVIIWDESLNQMNELPTNFLDSTSQLFLDLIASGVSTMKDLQEKYTKVKELNKMVSQPLVSKYISRLLKNNLVSEDWIEGFKNLYLSDKGYLHIHSDIERDKYKELLSEEISDLSEVSTVDLTQKLILSYRNNEIEIVNKIFQELLTRNDIEKDQFLLMSKRLEDFNVNKIKVLLESGLNLHKDSAELMTSLANIHLKEGNTKKAFSLCKEAVKIDPDYPEAWELLGKLTFSEK